MDSMNTFPDFIKTWIRLSFANNEYNQWRLVVKMAGRATKCHLWLNI